MNNDKIKQKDNKLYKSNKSNFDKNTKKTNASNIKKKLNQRRIKKIVKNLNNSDDYLVGPSSTQKIKFFISNFHINVKLKIKNILDHFVFE